MADMKDAISLLTTNLLDLKNELKIEEVSLEKFSNQQLIVSQALVAQSSSQFSY